MQHFLIEKSVIVKIIINMIITIFDIIKHDHQEL